MEKFYSEFALLQRLVSREIQSRYRGSALGFGWAIVGPMLMLLVFYFFLRVVLNARWPGLNTSDSYFAVNVFVGMLFHSALAEALTRSPNVILGNPNYVKKIVFPTHLLPISLGVGAQMSLIVGLVLLSILRVWEGNIEHFPILPAVFIVLLFGLFCCAVSLTVSAIGTYVRDIGQIVGMLATVLMFLSPVFYPTAAVPEPFLSIIESNPLTQFITAFRNHVVDAIPMPTMTSMRLIAISSTSLLLSFLLFKRMSKGFSDAI